MAINAESPKDAYAAFRDNDRKDRIASSLVNERQEQLLTAFFDEHPHMEQFLCKGLGLELMGTDGQIANMVLDYFTNNNEPVLCIHDSFLINYRKGEELKRIVEDSTFQHTGYRIQQDIKNQREENIVKVTGNIEGYETPQSVSIFRPQQVPRTEEYNNRKSKFYKWIETSKISNEE